MIIIRKNGNGHAYGPSLMDAAMMFVISVFLVFVIPVFFSSIINTVFAVIILCAVTYFYMSGRMNGNIIYWYEEGYDDDPFSKTRRD